MPKKLTLQQRQLHTELYAEVSELLWQDDHAAIFALIGAHPHLTQEILDWCANLNPHAAIRLMDFQQMPYAPCLDMELAEDMTWEVDDGDQQTSNAA